MPHILVCVLACACAAAATATPEDVVRRELRAYNEGDVRALIETFSRDARIFSVPETADRFAGTPSERIGTHERRSAFSAHLARRERAPIELVKSVCVGDLVAVELRVGSTKHSGELFLFSIYRVGNGRIENLWHVAKATARSHQREQVARDVIRRHVAASNAGDAEALLAQFSPDLKYFPASDEERGLADRESERMSHPASRRALITKAFAQGAPAQVTVVDMLALADLVATHDRATLRDGKILNQMKIYRLEGGLITHDWTAYEGA